MQDVLAWIQNWYETQCDGEWEHSYGVQINTLDNPGWSVKINLEGTELEGRTFPEIKRDISERDWIFCRVGDSVFEGYGGPQNLKTILGIFHAWSIDSV